MSPKKTRLRLPTETFFLLFLFFASLSCSSHQPTKDYLRMVEEVMETNPDSARRLLDGWSEAPRLVGENQALYAILRTQTNYKCDKPITDSIPLIATRYYGIPHRKNYHAAMAWYTLGCYYTNTQTDSLGIIAYLNALDCFPDTTNRYFRLSVQNLGQHYMNKAMLDNAIAVFERYYNLAEMAGDTRDMSYANYFLGFARLRKLDFTTADSLFVEVLQFPPTTLVGQLSLLNRAKIKIYNDKDYATALEMLRTYRKKLNNDRYCGSCFSYMGMCFQNLNQLDSALFYFNKTLVSTDIYTRFNAYQGLTESSLLEKEETEIFDYLQSYIHALDTILKQRDIEHISSLGIVHELENRKKEYTSNLNSLGLALLLVTVIAVLLTAFIITWLKNHRKAQALAIHEDLRKSELESARRDCTLWRELSPSEKEERRNSYSIKLRQCRKLFRETASDKILVDWQKEDTSVKANEPKKSISGSTRMQIIDDLGQSFIDVIQDLMMDAYPDAPKLIESDWLLCILSYLRVSQVRISELLSLQPGSIRKKKKRLEPKVPAEILDIFFLPSSMKTSTPQEQALTSEDEPTEEAEETDPSCSADE